MHPLDDDDRIPLAPPAPDEPDLGPDERDRDLMDGTWEQRYYSGQHRTRDWNTIGLGIAILVVIALVLPIILAAVNR